MRREKSIAAAMLLVAWTLGCDWKFNTNVPDGEGESGDGGGEWRTFFVGDAHIYDPACGLQNHTYCAEAYGCDVNGQDIATKLYDLQWQGVLSENDLHDFRMWKEAGAPPLDGVDFDFADGYNVAWHLGHSNIGYLSFSLPHEEDPWASPCILGGIQINLGVKTINGNHTGEGGHASVFIHLGSCGGYYGPGYDVTCVEKNWHNNVRQMLAFGGSPVVSKLQATDFIEELEKGKDDTDAWQDIMHTNHEEPFKENNPVVYTFATDMELGENELGTIADNANILTGDWVTPPLPTAMNVMGVSAYSGDQNLGTTGSCLPASAPLDCQ